MNRILTDNLDAIRTVCQQRHVRRLYAFGSAARDDDMHTDSDVDFLYSFDPLKIEHLRQQGFNYAKNLFGLEADLKRIVRREVDLMPDGIVRNPVMREEIAMTKRLLYANE